VVIQCLSPLKNDIDRVNEKYWQHKVQEEAGPLKVEEEDLNKKTNGEGVAHPTGHHVHHVCSERGGGTRALYMDMMPIAFVTFTAKHILYHHNALQFMLVVMANRHEASASHLWIATLNESPEHCSDTFATDNRASTGPSILHSHIRFLNKKCMIVSKACRHATMH
jgi:hypothetical protein